MAWTRVQYQKSLDQWERKEERYRKNWKAHKKGDPRRFYWFKLLKNAVRVVDRRQKQLNDLQPSVSSTGLTFIKSFEGFRSRPYQDPVGAWTIGYGETRGISRFTLPWSEKKAAKALKLRLDRDYLPTMMRYDSRFEGGLKQREIDAGASFNYNLGTGVMADSTSTMGKAVRTGSRSATAAAFLIYDKAGGRRLEGLARRREAERKMFLG